MLLPAFNSWRDRTAELLRAREFISLGELGHLNPRPGGFSLSHMLRCDPRFVLENTGVRLRLSPAEERAREEARAKARAEAEAAAAAAKAREAALQEKRDVRNTKARERRAEKRRMEEEAQQAREAAKFRPRVPTGQLEGWDIVLSTAATAQALQHWRYIALLSYVCKGWATSLRPLRTSWLRWACEHEGRFVLLKKEANALFGLSAAVLDARVRIMAVECGYGCHRYVSHFMRRCDVLALALERHGSYEGLAALYHKRVARRRALAVTRRAISSFRPRNPS